MDSPCVPISISAQRFLGVIWPCCCVAFLYLCFAGVWGFSFIFVMIIAHGGKFVSCVEFPALLFLVGMVVVVIFSLRISFYDIAPLLFFLDMHNVRPE